MVACTETMVAADGAGDSHRSSKRPMRHTRQLLYIRRAPMRTILLDFVLLFSPSPVVQLIILQLLGFWLLEETGK